MRRDPTPAEQVLWNALRERQLGGLKFRRQYAVGAFVLDFCCPERKLVIEVDGSVHAERRDHDEARTECLESYGYQVLRFENEEVLSSLHAVLARTLDATAPRALTRKSESKP